MLLKSNCIRKTSHKSLLCNARSINHKTPVAPPSYFSRPNENQIDKKVPNSPVNHQQLSYARTEQQRSKSGVMKDLTLIISMACLSYFAIDNYQNRIALQKSYSDIQYSNLQQVRTQQLNYSNLSKRRELQMLQERRNNLKSNMKLSLHVALLRKQLIELGAKPVEIDDVIREFEKNVRMETSSSNVTGTAIWLVEDSPLKGYLPDVRQYEKKP